MLNKPFASWMNALQQQLFAQDQRQLIVLSGEVSWSVSLLENLSCFSTMGLESNLQSNLNSHWFFYGESKNDNATFSPLTAKCFHQLNRQNYRQMLGFESSGIVFLADPFNIDAFAALSGTLTAGGVLFLLVPTLEHNASFIDDSRFNTRFFDLFKQSDHAIIIAQKDNQLPFYDENSPNNIPNKTTATVATKTYPLGCITAEQYQAVQAVEKVALGHRNRPFVLTADRGRGKSSALAIACGELLKRYQAQKQTQQRIIICAPGIKSLAVFFKQLHTVLPQACFQATSLTYHDNVIEFIPLDQLVKKQPKANLLLIDEAAALPIHLLTFLLSHYHRMVFSSTVHGYEGAGRGFSIKFQKLLQQQYPEMVKLHLNQPIRWRENDPLEKFVFDACLLNANLPELAIEPTEKYTFSVISAEQLLLDDVLLKQLFSVLVTAHYQTKPSDLQMLLDNTNVRILSLNQGDNIVAVALLLLEGKVLEGKENNALITQVKEAKRRLRDQFIPQSLLTHCGIEQAFEFSYLRIMRIAVHPQCQQQGIGSHFLSEINQYALNEHVDFIGSSFGLNQPLLNFWLTANYQIMRVGFSQDAASGEHSALVLKAVTTQSKTIQNLAYQANKEFYRAFDYLLTDEYSQLDDRLIWHVLAKMPPCFLPQLTDFDKQTVLAFAKKERLYSNCVYSLHLWFLHQLNQQPLDQNNTELSAEILPIIHRLLKKQSLVETCRLYGLTGKKAFNQLVVNFVSKQLNT